MLWGVKRRLSIIIGVLSYCFFSYFGALSAFWIGEHDLRIYFAILLIFIALIQIIPFFKKDSINQIVKKESVPLFWILILGSVTGAVGGLFGIGAGVLMVPILISVFKMEKEYARALSLAILVPPVSFGAYLKYNFEISIDWNLVLVLFLSYFVANYFGAKAGTKISTNAFKLIYSGILIAIAVIYIL